MELVIGKSKWEMWSDPLEVFLTRAKKDGFSAVEIYLKGLSEDASQITGLLKENNILLVGQILTEGSTYQAHINSLKSQFDLAYKLSPKFINTHAGRDIFTFKENVSVYTEMLDLSRQSGIPIYVETHRGRPTYSAIETRKYLEELPELEITADFSHWTVVHESDLSDQVETIELAIQRTRYIHARPGYEEGPQINDPRAPEWKNIMDLFLSWWQRIINAQILQGKDMIIITPEFGPPGYMHTLPYTNEPVADVWELNVYMKNFLTEKLLKRKNIQEYT